MEESVEKMNEKMIGSKTFGFRYVKGLTNENDMIQGGSFYLFSKQCLTLAVCNTPWGNENGEPYNFKLDGSVLFIKKVAIGIGTRG